MPDFASGENGSGPKKSALEFAEDGLLHVCPTHVCVRACVHVHAGRAAATGVCVHVCVGERRVSVFRARVLRGQSPLPRSLRHGRGPFTPAIRIVP